MDAIGALARLDNYTEASMDTSENLITRARRGDEEAFRLLFERYTRPIASFIFCMINDEDAAEELAQETFTRAYKSITSIREETKISTWVFGVAKNVAREALRKKQKENRHIEKDESALLELCDNNASPDGKLHDKEISHAIRRALAALDEDKRVVFTLKIYQQMSYEDICEVTGFTLPKVRNDLYRARAEMRRKLGRYVGRDK